MMKLRCFTLFDITKTNVTSKKSLFGASTEENKQWQMKRNTQCNLDTVTQVISLRAQPEDISDPVKSNLNTELLETFGFIYQLSEDNNFWFFDFSVNYGSVFSDGSDELGALYNDCEGVPMIKTELSPVSSPMFLDTTPELRNIYFTILSND